MGKSWFYGAHLKGSRCWVILACGCFIYNRFSSPKTWRFVLGIPHGIEKSEDRQQVHLWHSLPTYDFWCVSLFSDSVEVCGWGCMEWSLTGVCHMTNYCSTPPTNSCPNSKLALRKLMALPCLAKLWTGEEASPGNQSRRLFPFGRLGTPASLKVLWLRFGERLNPLLKNCAAKASGMHFILKPARFPLVNGATMKQKVRVFRGALARSIVSPLPLSITWKNMPFTLETWPCQ